MDSTEAKLILAACRWNGRDDDDPQVAAAMAQMQRDPALTAWWSEQRALDEAIAARLQASPVPETLKASVLAGRKLVRPTFWQQHQTWLAAAAVIVLLLSLVAGFWPRSATISGSDLAAFRRDMGSFLDGLMRLDFRAAELPKVNDWLAGNQGFANASLPASLTAHPPVGCRVIDWNQQKVTLICFRTGPGGYEKVVHLLIAERSPAMSTPAGKTTLAREGRWHTATWTDDRYVYLLAGKNSEEEFRRLVPDAG